MVTSANTLNELQKKLDTLSHNVSNVNTVGYKRRGASFQDLLTQQVNNQPHPHKEVGRQTPEGLRVGHGAKIGQTTLHTAQGAPQETGRPLDVMIEGEDVYFRVRQAWVDESGTEHIETVYTRDGALQLSEDPEGLGYVRLQTKQGLPLIDQYTGMSISFDQNYESIDIKSDGTVEVYYPDDDVPEEFQLSVAKVNRPDQLQALGGNLFGLEGDEEALLGDNVLRRFDVNDEKPYAVRQGMLELSNVDLSQELTEMIVTQRMMQFQSRSITIADEMMGLANTIRG
nr:flagellar hook-basal body protein [Caldalkalibacillus salinus]